MRSRLARHLRSRSRGRRRPARPAEEAGIELGTYLDGVNFGAIRFDRRIASTRVVGTAVFATHVADFVGDTGSIVVHLALGCRDVVAGTTHAPEMWLAILGGLV